MMQSPDPRAELRRAVFMLLLLSLGIALGTGLLASWKHFAPTPRVAAGADAGIRLLREHRCVTCHAPDPEWEELLRREPAPHLGDVGTRLRAGALERFLEDPDAARPGTAMPDLLAGLAAPERADAHLALADFLAAQGGTPEESTALPEEALEWGRQLYHRVGCVACHAPLEALASLETPAPGPAAASPELSLEAVAARWNFAALRDFLQDPLRVRPDGVMPSLDLSAAEAEAIAAYLCFATGGRELRLEQGLAHEYFEEEFVVDAPDFDRFEPAGRGSHDDLATLPPHREESFGFRYRGFLEVKEPGEHRFFTESDDGSRLWLDGELVVQNDGFHGMSAAEGGAFLAAGLHALEITYFEGTGDQGLVVSWQPPGGGKEVLPAEVLRFRGARFEAAAPRPVTAEARARGREWFLGLGCNACHALEDAPPPEAPPLASLAARAPEGCLAPEPLPGVPWFDWTPAEREALAAALAAVATGPPEVEPAKHVDLLLAELRCTACHARGGSGGPVPERRPYFTVEGADDLGDESRFPPPLDHVGAKLSTAWLERVLFEGASVRPAIVTRMPQFGPANVAALVDLFPAVDLPAFAADAHPELSDARIDSGCRLAGNRGLGCIQCHRFAEFPSLGMQSVDLTQMGTRLRYPWFRRLLLEPASLGMTTRMPAYFEEGRSSLLDVEDGSAERQVEALWSYVSLGSAMPLPDGLVPLEEEYEVGVTAEPVCVAVFLEDAGPRGLMVGLPERIHYAYDVEEGRLVSAWRGRFFHAEGTWHGRAGALEEAPPADRTDLPPGPTFRPLASLEEPWGDAAGRELGLRVRGRACDAARRPVFLYRLGDLEVEDHLEPYRREDEVGLRRRLTFTGPAPRADLWFRVAAARELPVEEHENGGSASDGRRRWTWEGQATVRRTAAGDECLLPVVFAPTKDEGSGSAEDGTLGEGLAPGQERFTAEVVVSFTWSRAEGREE